MSPKATPVDRLIAESKQVTSDLLALRHEMQRRPAPEVYGGWRERARLINRNLDEMRDTIFNLCYPASDPEPEILKPQRVRPEPRALGNGQLSLTSGGR